MGQAAKASLTARADREAATQWELVWTLPVHAHYGGPYTDWLYTSPGIKSGFKKNKKNAEHPDLGVHQLALEFHLQAGKKKVNGACALSEICLYLCMAG